MFDPDVIIIGGGPAGLAAGIVLGESRIPTLLCERARFPVDKPCGEGLMPTGLHDLELLGLNRSSLLSLGVPLTGVRYISARGNMAEASFAEGPGLGIRRTSLSGALRQRAREIDALVVREQTPAQMVAREAGGFSVRVEGHEFRPRLIIGADGLHSDVRRRSGLHARGKSRLRCGIRQHFELPTWTPYVEVYWAAGAEAYVTPVGPSQMDLAFLWDRERFQRRGGALAEDLLSRFPVLQHRLWRAPSCTPPRAVGSLHQRVSAPARDGVLLLGDAGGYLDAITGEGVSLALRQALSLRRLVIPAIQAAARKARLVTREELQPFVREANRSASSHRQVTRLLLRLRRSPRLIERLVSALSEQPDLLRHFLSANMGCVSPWRVPPGSLARFLPKLVLGRR